MSDMTDATYTIGDVVKAKWVSLNHDGPEGFGDQMYEIPNTAMWGEIGIEDPKAGTWSWVILGHTRDTAEVIEFASGICASEAGAKYLVESWRPRYAKVLKDLHSWVVYAYEPNAGQLFTAVVSMKFAADFAEAIKLADAWVNYRIERLSEEAAA